jgi:outer membrane murein-binding lipoprotein Lpp
MIRIPFIAFLGLSMAGCAVTTDDASRQTSDRGTSSDLVTPLEMRRPSAREASRRAAAREAARAVEELSGDDETEGDASDDEPGEMIDGQL